MNMDFDLLDDAANSVKVPKFIALQFSLQKSTRTISNSTCVTKNTINLKLIIFRQWLCMKTIKYSLEDLDWSSTALRTVFPNKTDLL